MSPIAQWAGQVIQVASVPADAELTGPWFAPNGKTLFLSVQDPGEYSPSFEDELEYLDKIYSSLPALLYLYATRPVRVIW
ncbi:MAG: DUF839 domain-containing protein [Saprospiraceae bacterium]|nr:DUF839 domain-containing protein [Saprospiraceae bacterium]